MADRRLTRFLSLPDLPAGIDPRVVVLPVPWERSTSYLQGTEAGPEALLSASAQVEPYDEELDSETWRVGIATLPPLAVDCDDPVRVLGGIDTAVSDIIGQGAVAVLLGGEHTLTVGGVAAAARLYEDLSVLQIDAHADLRDSFQGDRWSHACTMARVREICPHVGVGIRAMSKDEAELVREAGWPMWTPERCLAPGWVNGVIESLSEHVYVTIDLDGLDPSVVPAVGTPEPNGLSWTQCLELLRSCAARRTIVAADIVELCPSQEGSARSSFVAARLAYRLVGHIVTRGGQESCPEQPGVLGPDH
jgi:agmatinase